jgi:hypothetical protein
VKWLLIICILFAGCAMFPQRKSRFHRVVIVRHDDRAVDRAVVNALRTPENKKLAPY